MGKSISGKAEVREASISNDGIEGKGFPRLLRDADGLIEEILEADEFLPLFR
jgi:hypothetical protein